MSFACVNCCFLSLLCCLISSSCQTYLPDDFCDNAVSVNCDQNDGCRDCDFSLNYCKQCQQPNFFKLSNQIDGNDECFNCKDTIPNCLQCADTQGCQQCEKNVQPVKNKCGIKVCPMEGPPPKPTGAPTISPSASPTAAPTAIPTQMPLTLEDEYLQFTQDFVTNPIINEDLYVPDGIFCFGDFGCGGVDFVASFRGICDMGANTIVEFVEPLSTAEGYFTISQMTVCCESSLIGHGTFFIRSLVYIEFDIPSFKQRKVITMYLDGTDVDSFTAVRASKLGM